MADEEKDLRAALAEKKKFHDQFKWEIDQYIYREGKAAFEMWRQCQERHYKLSMDLQTEQVAFKLARTMLEDSLVGTEAAVSLLIQNMFQEAQEKAEAEGMAIEVSECCTVDDADVEIKDSDITQDDPATMYPGANADTLYRINDKWMEQLKRDAQRREALKRNARARQKWCEDISAQLSEMEQQVQLMSGARGHWVDVLKPKLPNAQRPRFKVMFEDIERRAKKTVRGMKTKRKADRNGVVALPPDGAITWMDHWAQVGMRANGAALRQSDYRMTSLEELYSSEGEQRPDDPNAPQPPVARRRSTTARRKPPRRPTTIVDQAILNDKIDKAVEEAKNKLRTHATQRLKQLKEYMDTPQYSLQSSKRINVDVLVEASGGMVGATSKPLGLGTPDVVLLWYRWGEMEDPPLPQEKVQEIIDAYSQYLTELFDQLDDWMRDHCAKSGGERKTVKPYNSVQDLNYNYSNHWKDYVFVWGGTAREYKGNPRTVISGRPDLKKFYANDTFTEPWQYREARVFGIISRPTHGLGGLPLDESIPTEVFTPEQRAQRKAKEEEERQLANAAGLQGLNEGFQEAKRAREEATKKEKERQRQIAKEQEARAAQEAAAAKTQWIENAAGSQEREEAREQIEKMPDGPLWLKAQERREERERMEEAEAEAEEEEEQDLAVFAFEADMRAAEEEAAAEAEEGVAAEDEEGEAAEDEEERRARIATLKREYDKLFAEMGELYTAWANAPENMTVGPALDELDPTTGESYAGAIAAFEADDEDQIHSALHEMREVYDRLSAELDQVGAADLFDEDDDSMGGGP